MIGPSEYGSRKSVGGLVDGVKRPWVGSTKAGFIGY